MEVGLVARWLVVLAAVWALGLPVARRLFPRFPYRGACLALPVALGTAFLPAYWVGKIDAGAGFVAAGLALVVAAAVAARSTCWPSRQRLGLPLAVFALAFATLLLVRVRRPSVLPVGGEAFLDFALLKAVLRAETLPPIDPWFAGRPVRYYYGGHLLAAMLTAASGVAPRFAYNLLLPTFYAALATAAFGLGAAVTDASGGRARLGGLAAAFLTAAAGNLATPVRLALGALPGPAARRYGHDVFRAIRMPYPAAVDVASGLDTWWHWYARYVIPATPDVFPMWTFVNGDLRPHATSAPFLVLAAAVAFAYYRTGPGAVRRRRVLIGAAMPAVAAVLTVVNTWELPVAVGLTFLAVASADADPASLIVPGRPERTAGRVESVGSEPAGETGANWRPAVSVSTLRAAVRRPLVAGGLALAVGAVGTLLVAPYLAFHTAPSRGVILLPPRSDLVPFLLVHGGFLALFSPFLAVHLARRRIGGQSPRRVAAAVGLLALGLAVTAGPVIALLAALIAVGWAVRRADGTGFAVVLALAGLGLVLVAELAAARVYPYDPAAPRWNTVYKLYHAAWICWGVGGGVVAARLVERGRERFDASTLRGKAGRRRWLTDGALPAATVVLVAAVLVSSAVFAPLAVVERATGDTRYPQGTLDGLAYVNQTHPDAGAAIAWLDDREGQPTIASAPGTDPYTWASAPSSLTGVPTLAGWNHERGYRGGEAYARRVAVVETIYEGPPAASRRLLREYGVAYVYVGPRERERYEPIRVVTMPGVEPAFQHGRVTVFAVEFRNRTAGRPARRRTT
ncbi:MAG: DUF2298 domain-containing protein [Halobacteriaceae archaeon]